MHDLQPLGHGFSFLRPHDDVYVADLGHGVEQLLYKDFSHEPCATGEQDIPAFVEVAD